MCSLSLFWQLEARDKRIAELKAEVKELKRTLNTNSGNSGISPSQDPIAPEEKEAERRTKTTRTSQGRRLGTILPGQIPKSRANAGREDKKGTRAIKTPQNAGHKRHFPGTVHLWL